MNKKNKFWNKKSGFRYLISKIVPSHNAENKNMPMLFDPKPVWKDDNK